MISSPDLVPLVADPIDFEPVGSVGADRLDEVETRLIFEVQAELVDVGGFENIIEPIDPYVTPEVIPSGVRSSRASKCE